MKVLWAIANALVGSLVLLVFGVGLFLWTLLVAFWGCGYGVYLEVRGWMTRLRS